MLIAEYATTHDVLSANEVRPLCALFGIVPSGAAFSSLVEREVLRKAGHVPSDSEATKAHALVTYQSLITREAMEERRVA